MFFVADLNSASSRLRVLQYVYLLRRDGHKVRICATRPSKYLMRPGWLPRLRVAELLHGLVGTAAIVAQRIFQICVYVPGASVVVLQKDMLFRTRIDLLERFVFRLARAAGRRTVFDLDDAIYLGTSLTALGHMRAKVARIAASADLVLAGSVPIATELRAAGARVMLAPTGIAVGPQPTRSYRLAADGVRLVWTGTAANVRHLFAMAWPLNEFVGSSGARITVVTRLASLPGDLLHPFVDVTFVDWSERAEAQRNRRPLQTTG